MALRHVQWGCQHLVDPPPIHIDDFEPPAGNFDFVANPGNAPELLEQVPGKGLIGPRSGKHDAEQFGKFDRGHPTRYQIRSIVALHESRLRWAFSGVKGADDRLQNIRARYDTLKNAVLVMDKTHMHGGVAQDRDNVSRIDGLRDDRSIPNQLPNVGRLSG